MNKKDDTVDIVKVREFSCAALPDISFKYPVFKNWEIRAIDNHADGCVIHLSWPASELGTTVVPDPQIEVSRIIYDGLPLEQFQFS